MKEHVEEAENTIDGLSRRFIIYRFSGIGLTFPRRSHARHSGTFMYILYSLLFVVSLCTITLDFK